MLKSPPSLSNTMHLEPHMIIWVAQFIVLVVPRAPCERGTNQEGMRLMRQMSDVNRHENDELKGVWT